MILTLKIDYGQSMQFKNEKPKPSISDLTFFPQTTPMISEMIEDILDEIEFGMYTPSMYIPEKTYIDLVRMTANCSENQLIRAINVCFNKATRDYYNLDFPARNALLAIIKQAQSVF
jgi:hypothetical protein